MLWPSFLRPKDNKNHFYGKVIMLKITKSFLQISTIILLAISFGGCGETKVADIIPFMSSKKEEEKPIVTKLQFEVAKNINPDTEGQASPVVVRIHQLSSRTVFDNNDFFALYEEPEGTLSVDLLGKDQFVFNPGDELEHKMTLESNTKFIGVLVAYRDIENARWRAVIKVDSKKDNKFLIALDRLSIFTEEKE